MDTTYGGGTHDGAADAPYSGGPFPGWGGSGLSCSGKITATITWSPDYQGEVLPQQTVYCLEHVYCVADKTCNPPNLVYGSADDGLGDASQGHFTGFMTVTNSQGYRLTPFQVGGDVTSFMVNDSPSASTPGPLVGYTGSSVTYQAGISNSLSITFPGAIQMADGPHFVIGQPFAAQVYGASSGSTFSWSVPSDALPLASSWGPVATPPTTSPAVPSAYVPPQNSSASSISCYFAKYADPETIGCTVDDPVLGTVHVAGDVRVDAPETIPSPTGSVAAIGSMYLLYTDGAGARQIWHVGDSPNPTLLGLFGAVYDSRTWGIWLPYMVTAIDGVTASYEYVQVINRDKNEQQGVVGEDLTDALDGSYPYSGPNVCGTRLDSSTAFNDAPDIPTITDVDSTGAIDIDTFTVFILYQPTGGSWVPVQATDWNCQAEYQHFLAGPQWRILSFSDSITSTHDSYGVFPVWTNFRSP